MNGKSLGMLALAVISGLGAMFGTSRMLAKMLSKAAVEMQDVLVATRDMKVEEVLTPELVKVVPMSKASVPAGTFTSFKDVEDRWVQIKTLEGEPVLDRKLAPKGTPAGLVSRIHPGMRAFTLEVNEHTGVSGFVLPDHRIDVVLSENKGNGPAGGRDDPSGHPRAGLRHGRHSSRGPFDPGAERDPRSHPRAGGHARRRPRRRGRSRWPSAA